jgi:TatD DNase family protein
MIDTHVHLCDKRFDKDRQQVFDRAHHVGVTHFVEIAYGPGIWEKAFALAAEHPNVFLAVGVHPNSAGDVAMDQLEALRSHARHARVVAIGEIGLDTFRDYAPLGVQEEWFRVQLALADQVGLPVIIHQRSEIERVLAMLEDAKPEAGGVLHCFDQDAATVDVREARVQARPWRRAHVRPQWLDDAIAPPRGHAARDRRAYLGPSRAR